MRIVISKRNKSSTDKILQASLALRKFRECLPLNIRIKSVNVYFNLEYTDQKEKVAFWNKQYKSFEEMTLDENANLVSVPDDLIPETRKKKLPYYIPYKPNKWTVLDVPELQPDEKEKEKMLLKKIKREEEERERRERKEYWERQEKLAAEKRKIAEAKKAEHLRLMDEDPEYREKQLMKQAAINEKIKRTREANKLARKK